MYWYDFCACKIIEKSVENDTKVFSICEALYPKKAICMILILSAVFPRLDYLLFVNDII